MYLTEKYPDCLERYTSKKVRCIAESVKENLDFIEFSTYTETNIFKVAEYKADYIRAKKLYGGCYWMGKYLSGELRDGLA